MVDSTTEQTGAEQSGSQSASTTTGTQESSQQSSSQAAGTTASPSFTYKEDRTDWIPRHRFNEVSQQARRAAELEAQIKERDAKIAALAGVTPKDPGAEKAEQVKAAFFQMFPQFKHLSNLTDEQMQALITAPEKAGRVDQFEQREWARHGKAQMSTLYSNVAEAIGAEALDDDQKADLRESFSAWFKGKCQQELEQSGGRESKTLQRYEEGDPALLNEFTKRFTDKWVEPARRKVTQQQLTRVRPVVNSGGRGVATANQPPKFNSLDDRIDFAAKQVFGR